MFSQLFSTKCVHCGKDVPGNSKFCPSCGKPVKGAQVQCGNCQTQNDAMAKYCVGCGRELSRVTAPNLVNNRWQRTPDDFAMRIDVSELRGFLTRELTVEPGTRAMLISDGENIGVVEPGHYTLQTLVDRIPLLNRLLDAPKNITAVLVDSGDAEIEFELADLFTQDPLKIATQCKLVVQLNNPALFITNLMKDQRAFPLRAVRTYLFDEVLDAAQEFIGKRSVDELSRNLELKRQIEVELEAHLNRTLERTGMRLVQLRTLDYKLDRYDKVRGIHEEYFLQISEQEAKNQGKRLLLDQDKASWVIELAEDTAKTEVYEQRAAVWERMRRAVLSENMSKAKSEEEWDAFLDEADKRKLLRAEERENLKRDILERRADHDKLRAFIAAKAELERDYDLKQIELKRRLELTHDQIQFELATERQRLEGRITLDTLRWESEIKKQTAEDAARRAREEANAIAAREKAIQDAQAANAVRLANAKTDAEVRAIEREQDRLDAERGILLLEKMKALKRADELERQKMELDRRQAELDLQLNAEQVRLELEIKKARAAHEQEMERYKTLGQMSTESLIVVSGAEQAGLLAELKKTETLKGMSEEQILALAAEKSPAVAQAFVEKFKLMAAASAEQQKQFQEMYERLLKEQKESSKSADDQSRENAQRLQDMFTKALDSQRDTATAFARGASQPPIVIAPGLGNPAVVQPGATSGQVQVCKKCHTQSPVGIRFCANCGEAFF